MSLTEVREEIKQRVVLSDWVGRWVKLHRKGHEYLGLCPFHQEKGPSFSVNNAKGFYHCFGCGAHGDIFSFLMHVQQWTFMEAMQHLAHTLNVSLPQWHKGEGAHTPESKGALDALQLAHLLFQQHLWSDAGRVARAYLHQRGFSEALCRTFQVGYAPADRMALKRALIGRGMTLETLIQAGLVITPDEGEPYDRFRDRIMFPIHNMKNQVVAFGGRARGDAQPKYLNSPETTLFHKGRILYHMHKVKGLNPASGSGAGAMPQPFLVMEGYFDVMRAYEAGWHRVVAPLGTAVTEEHLKLIWQRDAEPLFVLDGDLAGRKASERLALKALTLLSPGYSLKICFLPDGDDPDTLLRRESTALFQTYLNQSKPLVDFVWDQLFEQQDRSTPERWALARQNLMDAVKTIPDATVQGLYRRHYETLLREKEYAQTRFQNRKGARASAPLLGGKMLKAPKQADHKTVLLLLGMGLLYPAVVVDVNEAFAALPLKDPRLQKVRDGILDQVSQDPHISSESLWSLLQQAGWGDVLGMLKEHVHVHGAFVGRLQNTVELLESWREVWQTLNEPRRTFFQRSSLDKPSSHE